MRSDELRLALDEFTARIDALAPDSGPLLSVSVSVSPAAARALVEALRGYHDPRDHGRCSQCGVAQLDASLTCTSCGQPDGLFGQLIRERLAREQ